VSYILRPIIRPVVDIVAQALLPKWVANNIEKLIPNIGIFGAGLSMNFNPELPLGLGLGVEMAAEGVYASETARGAAFLAFTLKAGFVGEDPGGIHAFVGLGWNVKSSEEYTHPKVGFSVPFASLFRRIQDRVWADITNRLASYMSGFMQQLASQASPVGGGYAKELVGGIVSSFPNLTANVLHFLDKCEATILWDGHSIEVLLDYNFLEEANYSTKPRLAGLGLVGSWAAQIWPWGGEDVEFKH
jgi:hypothetical protein